MCSFCAKSTEITENRSGYCYQFNHKGKELARNARFTRSASPGFFGGVSSSGRLSINLVKDLHSAGDKSSYKNRQY